MNVKIEFLSPSVNINRSFTLTAEIKSATQAYCELVAEAADSIPEVIAASKKIESLLITDTASGPIASFPDGADNMPLKSLVINIDPVQDLHGYDNPWPAGGGKNLLPLKDGTYTIGATGVTATVSNSVISLSGTASSNGGRTNKLTDNFTLAAGTYFIKTNADSDSVIFINNASTSAVINTGDNRSFTLSEATEVYAGINVNAGTNYNGKTSKPMLNSGSTAETFAPYSNVCPISGHAGGTVKRWGINQWDEEYEVGTINVETGANTTGSNRIRSKNYIPVIAGRTYYFLGAKIQPFFYDKNKNYIGYYHNFLANGEAYAAMSGASYMRFIVEAAYGQTYNHDISINYPSTDHDYHAYTGQTKSISFGSTIYGGTDEVVSGSGVKTWDVADMGDLNWTYDSANTRFFTADLAGTIKPAASFVEYATGIKCSMYKASGDVIISPVTADACIARFTNGIVYVKNSAYTNESAFKTAMTGQKLVYELATPSDFTTEPVSISSLYGQNNIWADTGDTEVEYVADPKLYINKVVAALA